MHASVQRTKLVSRHEWCVYAGSGAVLRLVLLGLKEAGGKGLAMKRKGSLGLPEGQVARPTGT